MEAQRDEPERGEREAAAGDGVEPAVVCPFCKDALVEGRLAATCAGCQTAHHAACFEEHGGCSVTGCGRKEATIGARARPTSAVTTGRSCRTCRKGIPAADDVVLCTGCTHPHHASCHAGRADACCAGKQGLLLSRAARERLEREAPAHLRWLENAGGFGCVGLLLVAVSVLVGDLGLALAPRLLLAGGALLLAIGALAVFGLANEALARRLVARAIATGQGRLVTPGQGSDEGKAKGR